jgi:hypothetical protein
VREGYLEILGHIVVERTSLSAHVSYWSITMRSGAPYVVWPDVMQHPCGVVFERFWVWISVRGRYRCTVSIILMLSVQCNF